MTKKTLMGLIAVLAALCAALVMTGRRETAATTPAAGERPLLAGVELGSVRALTIADNTATTRLAQADGAWTVAEQEQYAADLDRLRGLLRQLDATEGGEVVETDSTRLAEYGLAVEEAQAPLRITLEHAAGTTVLALGKTREPRRSDEMWGPPPGRFVRVDEGPVRLLKDDLRVSADPAQWWDRQVLAVPPEAVRKVEVAADGKSYALERDTNGVFRLADAAADEQVDAAAAERLFGALQSLTAEALVPAAEATNEAAFAAAARYQAQASNAVYTLQVGAAQAENGGSRWVKIDVAAAGDAAPDQQAAAAALAKKLAGRVFRIPAYLAESLTLQRDALVKIPEPPPEPAAAPEIPAESMPPPVPAGESNH